MSGRKILAPPTAVDGEAEQSIFSSLLLLDVTTSSADASKTTGLGNPKASSAKFAQLKH